MKNGKAVGDAKGYFPAGSSVLRQVHSVRLVGALYGQRALIIGGTNPRNYIGTSEHTKDKQTPFRRLARTAKAFETIYFDDRSRADRLLGFIHQAHSKVSGTLPKPAGAYSSGTSYSALDPEMMLWTVICLADSAETFYRLFVRPLNGEEQEQFWQDYRTFGELFGLPKSAMPATYKDYRTYIDQQFSADNLYLTDSAKFMGALVCFRVPVPFAMKPLMSVANILIRGTLPPRVCELYGLSWKFHHKIIFRVVSVLARGANTIASKRISSGRSAYFFDMVASTEARRAAKNQAEAMPDNPY